MDKKLYRYGSFALFPPDSEIYLTHFADAGFYYEGNGDEVVCFSCGLKHRGWKKGDSPMLIHKSRSPRCPFLIETGNINVAIASRQPEETFAHEHAGTSNNDTISNRTSDSNQLVSDETPENHLSGACGGPSDHGYQTQGHQNVSGQIQQTTVEESILSTTRGNHIITSPTSENISRQRNKKPKYPQESEHNSRHQDRESSHRERNIHSEKTSLKLEPLGVSVERPVYPQFAINTVRMSSFRNWPKQLTQKPQDLAKAGFFHEGVGDRVRCFFCGGGLVNWDPEDEPWTEHARWYPRCVYLRQSKGDDFIYKVQAGEDVESKTETVTDPLSHPASVSVLDMGCKPDNVSKAWKILLKDNGQENITAEKLLVKVWQLEEEEINKSSHKAESGSTTADENENVVNTGKENKKDHDATSDSKKEESKVNETETNLAERMAIAEENRQLKEQQTCKICLDEDVSIVFLPCGHLAACASCAPALRKCPICRTFIKGTVRAIIS